MTVKGTDEHLSAATRAWVARQLATEERIVAVTRLRGGWTSEMRRLTVHGLEGERGLVLRSFVAPFFVRHAEGLLGREAEVLRLLSAPSTNVPTAELVAVDATGEHCEHPSLLMSLLPGRVRLEAAGSEARADLLAEQLVAVHHLKVGQDDRPRTYQAWTAADRVRVPEATLRPEVWARAIKVISGEPPAYQGRSLHRDFHPGNVLFDCDGSGQLFVSGVVDWVETSWGPSDLDVAHCSTTHALLYGVEAGLGFPGRYEAAGGNLSDDSAARLYWQLLDALAFAPDAEKVVGPWRELGRTDLTCELLAERLEAYVAALLELHGRS